MGENEGLIEKRRVGGSRKRREISSVILLISICMVIVYRWNYFPKEEEEEKGKRFVWVTAMIAEFFFSFYWLLTQPSRFTPLLYSTFLYRLSSSRTEDAFPAVDIFVCTADPRLEPPFMVANTVLSLMAFDYPPEKLAVYVSDDGCSHLIFYALLLASRFALHWLPFCRKFNVQPRSPSAFFSSPPPSTVIQAREFELIKELFDDMKNRIETASHLGRVSSEESNESEHASFRQSPKEHDTVLKMLIDGRSEESKDNAGIRLPSLVYLAREKRLDHPHNFKAGAMNALLRVSSEMSNAGIILNVDCDMYSNNPLSVRDALCFFLDRTEGKRIAFVQFAQWCRGDPTNRDLYGNSLRVIGEVEFPGMNARGGPLYVGSGCFHRRDALYGAKYREDGENEGIKGGWRSDEEPKVLIERVIRVAECLYEKKTLWGKEKGVRYGFPVEDVVTGLSMQCNGWRSIFFKETKKGFVGMAPTTLLNTLVQHKRWSEGDFLILLSKLGPLVNGFGKISLSLRMCYSSYCCWAPSSIPILFYSLIPTLLLLAETPLFPHLLTPWFLPFGYIALWRILYSFVEYKEAGGTTEGWWNDQRMWLYKRITSYLFAFMDVCLSLTGWSAMGFEITGKVEEREAQKRYEEGLIEFGVDSPMFTIITVVGLCNLMCVTWVLVKKGVIDGRGVHHVCTTFFLQIFISGLLVVINIPLYRACFFRRDGGKMPVSVTVRSMVIAMILCCCFLVM